MKTKNMTTNVDNVVLSYPYEGGLYYLLSRENPSGAPPEKGHSYYESLYGPTPKETKNHAVNLLSLFNEVILPPADEYLPDHGKCNENGQYYNADLRLRVDNNWDFTMAASDIAPKLLNEPEIAALFTESNAFPKDRQKAEFILARTVAQLRLAVKNNAVIVGGEATGELVARVWRLIASDVLSVTDADQPRTLTFSEDVLQVTALDWRCKDVEALSNIRTSPEVSQYAAKFRHAVFNASQQGDFKSELLNLMGQAMESEAIANKVKGALEITGLATTGVGLIPLIGNVAAAASLTGFLGYKKAERKETAERWYLLGSKIREIDLKKILADRPKT